MQIDGTQSEYSVEGTQSEYSVELGTPQDWWELDLNRSATSISSVENVSSVLSGFKWNSGDEHTDDWLPQGITGLRKTGLNKKFIVVSWYNTSDDNKGVRLSFVDLANRKYRHVLLVVPNGQGGIAPLDSHAGGIATIGHRIYVAHTNFGIREFDAQNICSAVKCSKSSFGICDGVIPAHICRYIMPQVRSYDFSDSISEGAANVPKFSFLSRVWTETDDDSKELLSGNFTRDNSKDSKYENEPSRVCRWTIDAENGIITQQGDIIQLNCHNVQGAVLRRVSGEDVLYLSRSYGQTKYRLYVVKVPSGYKNDTVISGYTKYDWCARSEDLFLSSSDNLWCLTETKSTDSSSIAERVVFRVNPKAICV